MGKIHSFRWTKSHHPIQIFVNPCLKFPSNIRFNPSTIWFSELFSSYQILGFAEKAQVSGSGPRRPSAETRRGQPDTGAGAVSRGSKTGGSMDSMDPHTWYLYFFCTKISFKISHESTNDEVRLRKSGSDFQMEQPSQHSSRHGWPVLVLKPMVTWGSTIKTSIFDG